MIIRAAIRKDFEQLWTIFHEVVSSGDTSFIEEDLINRIKFIILQLSTLLVFILCI